MQEYVTFTEIDGKLVCSLAGHFDTAQSQRLQELLVPRLSSPGLVVLEMGGVVYVCSAFLRVCVLAAKSLGPDRFSVVGLNPPVKRVFKIAGMTEIFTCL